MGDDDSAQAPVTINGVIYRFDTLIQRKFFDQTAIRLLERPVPVAEQEKNEPKLQVVPRA